MTGEVQAYARAMLSCGLRRFAARAVPLVVMVAFSVNICSQEHVEAEFAELVIGCRDTPSRSSAVSLEVTKAWVDGDALFGDLLVANHSESAIRLPRENVGHRYWDVAFLADQNVPVADDEDVLNLACGGLPPTRSYGDMLRMSAVLLEDLVTEKDIETIASGQTVLLRAVYLAPFWTDPRESGHEVPFEVTYRGWSRITVAASTAAGLNEPLAEATSRHCSLYGGELKSTGRLVTP